MRITTAERMASIDRRSFDERGLPEAALMETAGQMVARHAREQFPLDGHGRIHVYAGKGHNGADGLVAARWFLQWGHSVDVWLAESIESCSDLTRTHFHALPDGPSVRVHSGPDDVPDSDPLLVLDGLLGTGLAGDPRPPFDRAIDAINRTDAPVVAVDAPSGLSGDHPRPYDPCVQADLTVTFGLPKVGLLAEPGYLRTGDLIVQGLTFPPDIVAEEAGDGHLISPHESADWLPARKPDDHKGSAGRLAIVAGSESYPGAPQLVADAAGRTGTGLISMILPDRPRTPFPANSDAIYPLTQKEIWQHPDLDQLDNQDAFVVGPGLGDRVDSADLRSFLLAREQPVVLDADGLNRLAEEPDILRELPGSILTPHPGEAGRLLDRDPKWIVDHSLEAAEALRELTGQTVLLKTSRPVVAHPNGSYSLHVGGHPALATAGSGDVLCGILGALLASGLPPGKAACLGLYLHGGSSRLAAREIPDVSVRAGDLPSYVPDVIQSLRNDEIPDWYPVRFESVSEPVLNWHPWTG